MAIHSYTLLVAHHVRDDLPRSRSTTEYFSTDLLVFASLIKIKLYEMNNSVFRS